MIRTADAVIVTDVSRLDASRVASLERCVGILCSNDPDLPLVDRDELFRTADAVVLCATYTPGSPPLVARETLALVKPSLIRSKPGLSPDPPVASD